ncbi:MAG: hypothetical protein JO180_00920, partial [Gemmatirosa sp.]|nr:hypothetical protein [Gemmatirosa sp.]
ILTTLACGLLLVPQLWGFVAGRPWEWIAGIGGAMCGAAGAETVRRLARPW